MSCGVDTASPQELISCAAAPYPRIPVLQYSGRPFRRRTGLTPSIFRRGVDWGGGKRPVGTGTGKTRSDFARKNIILPPSDHADGDHRAEAA